MAIKNISIVKGSKKVRVRVQFKDHNTDEPVNLNGFVSSNAYFPAADSTLNPDGVAVSGTLVSEDLGEVDYLIEQAQLEAMNVGEEQDWEQEVDLGESGFVSQILGNLNIIARLF